MAFLIIFSFFLSRVLSQCAVTCWDGIKNGQETGVDCGGNCETCAPLHGTTVPLVSSAICSLTATDTNPAPITGQFSFVPNSKNSYDPFEPSYVLDFNYIANGLTRGDHKFHVHNLGDLWASNGNAVEDHFVGQVETGSRPSSLPQEVGLLNFDTPIQVLDNDLATGSFSDSQAHLNGLNSILGRAMIIHGDGSNETTSRAAQCVIGIQTLSSTVTVEDSPTISRASARIQKLKNVSSNVDGFIDFQLSAIGKVQVLIMVSGLPTGSYKIYVNERGDLTSPPTSLGLPFVGTITPNATTRIRVGEIGGINFALTSDANKMSRAWFTDAVVQLNGVNSIVGRSVAIYDSSSNMIACGVIGLLDGFDNTLEWWTVEPPAGVAPLFLSATAFIKETTNAPGPIMGYVDFGALPHNHYSYPGGYVRVKWMITGLPANQSFTVYISTYGETSSVAAQPSSLGPSFPGHFISDPDRINVGDLGWITSDEFGNSRDVLFDKEIMLNNYNSILGRAFVIADDVDPTLVYAYGLIGVENERFLPTTYDSPTVTEAICRLEGTANTPGLTGNFKFTVNGNSMTVAYDISGVTSATYTYHVHQKGNVGDRVSGKAVTGHFIGDGATNPRSPSNLCEVGAVNGGQSLTLPGTGSVSDSFIKLNGLNGIIGRSMILHAADTSRVGQCVIGILTLDTNYSPSSTQIPPEPDEADQVCYGVDCNGHGFCNTEGLCDCDSTHFGPTCAELKPNSGNIYYPSFLLVLFSFSFLFLN